MTESQAEGPDAGRQLRRGGRAWRVGTPVAILLCGSLFVISAENSEGTDLRPGRYTDLASLVRAESAKYDALEDRVTKLTDDITELTETVPDQRVQQAQTRADQFRDPAGLEPRSGAGVVVSMSDTPEEVRATSDQPPNLLVVHQQDLQSVVNAMWVGGATAITIQGQRVISTTGIKCEGNTVQLQGVAYAQPYVIRAIGDQGDITAALEDDPSVSGYREDSQVPDIAIGWDFGLADQLEAPAYEGLLDINHAEPIPG